jgi:hypothetical protein
MSRAKSARRTVFDKSIFERQSDFDSKSIVRTLPAINTYRAFQVVVQ